MAAHIHSKTVNCRDSLPPLKVQKSSFKADVDLVALSRRISVAEVEMKMRICYLLTRLLFDDLQIPETRVHGTFKGTDPWPLIRLCLM